MYDGLNSPNIYNVNTMADYALAIQSHPDAKIWAGGSYIMTRPEAYPARASNEDIIYLGEMQDFKRTQRNDRILEYGAMVSLYNVANSNKSVLPKLLEDTILSIGSSLITSRATIGGALSIPTFTTSLPGTLIALNANIEIKYAKKKRIHSKWIPISHTIDKNGKVSLPSKALISRIRIGINNAEIQSFYSYDSIMEKPNDAIAVAFASDWNQDFLVNPRLAITFPLYGICYSRDIDNILSSIRFPLDEEEYSSLESIIFASIDSTFSSITELQMARVKGALEEIVSSLNNKSLTETSDLYGDTEGLSL